MKNGSDKKRQLVVKEEGRTYHDAGYTAVTIPTITAGVREHLQQRMG